LRTLLALVCWLFATLASAQNVLPVPELTGRVIDQTGTLDAIQRKGLDDRLADFERTKGTQMVFLLVPTTQPEDIASYANRVGNAWKIGRKGVGDSVLMVVAKDDRKIRIEVAKTLEGAIPDLAARQIIDEAITPRFRAGDYIGGLSVAADRLQARVQGEALPAPTSPAQRAGPGFDWFDLAIFLFFAVPVASAVLRGVFGRKLGALITGGGAGVVAQLLTASTVVAVGAGLAALVMAFLSGGFGGSGPVSRGRNPVRDGTWRGGPWVSGGSSSGGWGGFGGGGSGGGFGDGGGFSSGGGGDFGGGGASGDW
jgi:uncharacterized protein